MNLIPPALYQQFVTNNCRYDVAKPFNNAEVCSGLEDQVNNLIEGLNPYDLFRTTYGMGSSVATSRRLQESKAERKTHGSSLVGDEIKTYQRGVR
jgi:hypothetical protein